MITKAIYKVQSQGSQNLRMREVCGIYPQLDTEGVMVIHKNPRAERTEKLEADIQGKRHKCLGRESQKEMKCRLLSSTACSVWA